MDLAVKRKNKWAAEEGEKLGQSIMFFVALLFLLVKGEKRDSTFCAGEMHKTSEVSTGSA